MYIGVIMGMPKPKPGYLTQKYLKSILDYNPNTGVFIWKVFMAPKAMAGMRAGSLTGDGYHLIFIKGRAYQAHHLAWKIVFGRWPEKLIDHKDGNKSNNKLRNLREATTRENIQNQRNPNVDSTTGYLGVSFITADNNYRAGIWHKGKYHYLGGFKNPVDAHKAYLKKKRELHSFCTI